MADRFAGSSGAGFDRGDTLAVVEALDRLEADERELDRTILPLWEDEGGVPITR